MLRVSIKIAEKRKEKYVKKTDRKTKKERKVKGEKMNSARRKLQALSDALTKPSAATFSPLHLQDLVFWCHDNCPKLDCSNCFLKDV